MQHDAPSNCEREIDAALKALPEVPAPPTLMNRVLTEIHERQRLPWYRAAWHSWPLGWRTASLLLLAAFTGGFGFGLWQFGQSVGHPLCQEFVSRAATAAALGDAILAVGNAAILALKHLGPNFVAVALAIVSISYFLCIGTGTLVVRYALARHQRNSQ